MRYVLLFAFGLFGCVSNKPTDSLPTYTIGASLNTIDDRIFGAFFEKATWSGEIGSDAAISLRSGVVFPEVKEYMAWMQIPLLRYPGGTAVDYYPWYNLIDSMPGHHGTRPRNAHVLDPTQGGIVESDGRMGLHEYMVLCRELGIEPQLVVNLGEGYYHPERLLEAAEQMGADFVRYCNDTSGPWAELRAHNGHPAPFGVKYWQIGNETWLFEGLKYDERTEAAKARLTESILTYARAMRTADASIVLIADGAEGLGDGVRAAAPGLIDYYTFHAYTPWGIGEVKRHDEPVAADTVDPAEVWRGLVAAPQIDPVTGQSRLDPWAYQSLPTDQPLALTEWNWNGWFSGKAKAARPANELLAYGLGSAGFLHGILRESGRIRLANQSMLVGTNWHINGIRVDTTEAMRPYMHPSAMVTGLYRRQHGNELLDCEVTNAHYYAQPLTLGNLGPLPKVAEQDVVVTADGGAYYLHIINRAYAETRALRFVFPEPVAKTVTHYLLSDRSPGTRSPYAAIETPMLRATKRRTIIHVPPRSVSVVRVARR